MNKTIFLLTIVTGLQITAVSQNVGIGTATPAEKLHVAGNIKADTVKPAGIKLTTNAGAGKILTSDAAGNANWQKASSTGSAGFGSWGTDCATIATIGGYQPVADSTGATGDAFGCSVSMSGNYAIVGANNDDVGANADQGSVSIYQYNGNGWVWMQKITDATGAAGDNFGISVSISGNYAIVGAYNDDVGANADQGSVSIYQYNGTSWVLMQKITDAAGAAGDNFGISVCILGNNVVVGAFFDDVGANVNQGSAGIYQFNGTSWVFTQQLVDAGGAFNDFFGRSVSMSGNYIVVTAHGDDVGANANQGSASIYQFNGTSWIFMQQLTDATGAINDGFGTNASLSGNYVIIGATGDDVGANVDQGSVSIFQYNGTSWVLMQKITDAAGLTNDAFGYNVCISGNYAIVGAYGDDVGANINQGSATIYLRVGLAWQKLQYVTDPGGSQPDNGGTSVVIDSNSQNFLIGANNYAAGSGKVIFGKIN